MVSEISRESGRLPWQPNLGKKLHLSSLQEIKKFFACTAGISGLVNFNMLLEYLREPRELPWKPNVNKNKPKLHWFQFCARNQWIFHMKSQVFVLATSNMLSRFSREPRELPWQPNSEKIKQKLHKFLFLARNRGIFRMFSMVLWASWIQICYLNFQGSWTSCHGNQISAKISQNCTNFNSLQEI